MSAVAVRRFTAKQQKRDPSIGMATVYRMVKTLEEAGLIQRKNMYRIDYAGYGSRAHGVCMKGKEKGS
ncbi:MAG: transcriptional repressor [Clostridium sp.]